MQSFSPIAAVEFLGIRADESRVAIRIEIGSPYQVDEHRWACPVSLKELYQHLADQRGGDAFQALCLAIGLVRNLLLGFIEDGGRIVFPQAPSQEVPLHAYFPVPLPPRDEPAA